MINAWSLLYEELNGTMDKTYPIENNELNNENINITTGIGNTAIYNVPNDVETDVEIDDTISITGGDFIDFTSPEYSVDTLDLDFSACYNQDDTITFGEDIKPEPNLDYKPHKYEEDKGIADLKTYVTSTYKGHYTSEQNNTQTLDLIQSVGDAESFCRSNAIKYLARYDKKGSAKQDILKAMHYCLLLYYFSGNTKEPDYTNTRYETF